MKSRQQGTNIAHGLKILVFFIHRYRWGEYIRGDERRFLEIARQFKNLGATVYALEVEPSLQENLNESIYTSLKIRFKLKAPESLIEQIATLFHLILSTFRLSLKVHYDLIYVYNQDTENVIPAYFLKMVSRKPLVIVFQLFHSEEKISIKNLLSIRFEKGFSPQAAFVASVLDIIKRFAYRRADFYLTNSHSVKSDVMQYLKVQKVVVSGNGVDANKFRPYNIEKIYDAAILGRVHPQKGIELLLKAWRLVLAKNLSAKLVLIGSGKRNHIRYYKALIAKLGLEKHVEMKGFVPDEEAVRLLNSSKLFVFPSLYEGFALSVAEAMACGLPCIISDIPALKENYGEVAMLVKPNSIEDFAEAIIELLKNEKKRKELGNKAKEYVKKFDWENVAKRELNVINSLLSKA